MPVVRSTAWTTFPGTRQGARAWIAPDSIAAAAISRLTRRQSRVPVLQDVKWTA
jgi:hypothetical protein